MKFIRLLILLVIFSPVTSEAATLHAILVGDTDVKDIGPGVVQNINHMTEEVKLIAKHTELNLELRMFTGSQYNSQLLKNLKSLNIQSDDVVIFYYSGHGYRTHDKDNIWPNIWISNENKGIDQQVITNLLAKKNPRFLLSLVNSCNSYVEWDIPYAKMITKSMTPDTLVSENYRKLFLETQGVIMSSSSSPGEYSWINLYHGDFYTNTFLESLHNEVNREEIPDWEAIFQITIDKTLQNALHWVKTEQTPQFQFIPNCP